MSSDAFVVTQEMLDSNFCPLNCPNLYKYNGAIWTCEVCGGLPTGRTHTDCSKTPIRRIECVLPTLFLEEHVKLVESLAVRLETRGDYDYPIIERAQEAQTAAALRVLLKKVAKK